MYVREAVPLRWLNLKASTLSPIYHVLLSPTHHENWQSPRSQSMSHSQPTASSSNNYQLIFNNALKEYEKRTKQDLLAHPLAAQLQSCDSPSAIIDVLQQQIQEINQSRTSDEKFTKWLDPTVNVLYALSATLGEGVGLVRLDV